MIATAQQQERRSERERDSESRSSLCSQDILKAARIGAASFSVADPAVSRDDIHQEICLYLLERDDIDGIELAVWMAKRRIGWRIKRSHVVRRLRQEALGDFDGPEGKQWQILEGLIDAEELLLAKRCELTKAQRIAIDGILAGHTPKEVCDANGMSLSSFSNALSKAIRRIRRDVGVDESLPVRLGRCQASESNEPASKDRPCECCGETFEAPRVDSRFCSDRCRWTVNNRQRTKRK